MGASADDPRTQHRPSGAPGGGVCAAVLHRLPRLRSSLQRLEVLPTSCFHRESNEFKPTSARVCEFRKIPSSFLRGLYLVAMAESSWTPGQVVGKGQEGPRDSGPRTVTSSCQLPGESRAGQEGTVLGAWSALTW